MLIQKHEIETYDQLVQLGWPNHQSEFFQVSSVIDRPELRKMHDYNNYFCSVMMLEAESIRHIRYIYGLLDILGDLGGVTEVIMLLFGFFLFPISEHSFILQALRRLYKARTKDDTIFRKDDHDHYQIETSPDKSH